ncbi:MAG: hypothetical protein ACKVUS_09790 [Saprospiraceae bacterium]
MINKKLLLAGAVAVAGFFTLTAFDGKTLAQQKEEIAAAVTVQLEGLRAEKMAECDARVAAEAATQVEAWMAEMAAAPAPTPGKSSGKGKGSKPAKVEPLPAGTKPAPTTKTDEKVQNRLPGNNDPNKPADVKTNEKVKSRLPVKPGGGGK